VVQGYRTQHGIFIRKNIVLFRYEMFKYT